MEASDVLDQAHAAALHFLRSVDERRVAPRVDPAALRANLEGEVPEHGEPASEVIERLVRGVEPGLVASVGPRYFGFVTGGALPVALAADWLTSAWDQNAFGYVMSPAASVVEGICAGWLLDLLALPSSASVGFVTGGQMANFVCLCAARDHVLAEAGVDVEQEGLASAGRLTVFVGAQGHATIHSALRMLGIGKRQIVSIDCDEQGRMLPDPLQSALATRPGPAIVCAQAGNVNTGAFDPFEEIVRVAHARQAWVHVDGAFGLWARAATSLRGLTLGAERADSWAVDGHKWLNVPYDSGFAIVARPEAHRKATRISSGAYLVRGDGERDGNDWVPESSRRARAFAVYAALRYLGRTGVEALVTRHVELAQRMAQGLERDAGAIIMNDVALNQVLARFEPPHSAEYAQQDAHTRAVIERVQREGTCWVGPSVYAGRVVMRVSISNWSTRAEDVDLSIAAIARAAVAGSISPSEV